MVFWNGVARGAIFAPNFWIFLKKTIVLPITNNFTCFCNHPPKSITLSVLLLLIYSHAQFTFLNCFNTSGLSNAVFYKNRLPKTKKTLQAIHSPFNWKLSNASLKSGVLLHTVRELHCIFVNPNPVRTKNFWWILKLLSLLYFTKTDHNLVHNHQ